jgi:hypothetical protein
MSLSQSIERKKVSVRTFKSKVHILIFSVHRSIVYLKASHLLKQLLDSKA